MNQERTQKNSNSLNFELQSFLLFRVYIVSMTVQTVVDYRMTDESVTRGWFCWIMTDGQGVSTCHPELLCGPCFNLLRSVSSTEGFSQGSPLTVSRRGGSNQFVS